MLLTNDGDLANFIISARNGVPKTYLLKIKGALSEATRKKLEKGMFLEGERLNPFVIEDGEDDQQRQLLAEGDHQRGQEAHPAQGLQVLRPPGGKAAPHRHRHPHSWASCRWANGASCARSSSPSSKKTFRFNEPPQGRQREERGLNREEKGKREGR